MKSVKVKMSETTEGSPNGVATMTFEKEVEYDLPSSLAEVFVDELKVAVIVESPESESPESESPESESPGGE